MSRACLVLCSFADAQQAQAAGVVLVAERLAACVSVLPQMQSIYRWQGEVQCSAEALAIIKTSMQVWPTLRQRLRQLHAYEVPEVLAIEPVAIDPDYERWLMGQVGPEVPQA